MLKKIVYLATCVAMEPVIAATVIHDLPGTVIEERIPVIAKSNEAVPLREDLGLSITEYVVNGRVYLIKVEGENGILPAYYFSDRHGRGQLKSTKPYPDADIALPEWRLLSW